MTRILTRELSRYYIQATGSPTSAAPAFFSVVQRFGSAVNLHVHVHAVVSDGTFLLCDDGRLVFHPATALDAETVRTLTQRVRRKILKRMAGMGAVPKDAVNEMMARTHGGFSLNGNVSLGANDRDGLERLLSYCLRPVISLKRLHYDANIGRVRYEPIKRRPGDLKVLEWTPVEFLGRLAAIIAPPRLNLVRYSGALGPRSRLRKAVTAAARERLAYGELLQGAPRPRPHLLILARTAATKAASAASKAWAICLKKVFEVNPILCRRCGMIMEPVSAIVSDRELVGLLTHLNLPTQFPRTKRARSPPISLHGEDSQIDPSVDTWEGIDEDEATGLRAD